MHAEAPDHAVNCSARHKARNRFSRRSRAIQIEDLAYSLPGRPPEILDRAENPPAFRALCASDGAGAISICERYAWLKPRPSSALHRGGQFLLSHRTAQAAERTSTALKERSLSPSSWRLIMQSANIILRILFVKHKIIPFSTTYRHNLFVLILAAEGLQIGFPVAGTSYRGATLQAQRPSYIVMWKLWRRISASITSFSNASVVRPVWPAEFPSRRLMTTRREVGSGRMRRTSQPRRFRPKRGG